MVRLYTLRTTKVMLSNAFSHITILITFHIQKREVWRLAMISLFIATLIHPFNRNSPLRRVALVEFAYSVGIVWLQCLAFCLRLADADDPYTLCKHENGISRFNLLDMAWESDSFLSCSITAIVHFLFKCVAASGSMFALPPICIAYEELLCVFQQIAQFTRFCISLFIL